MKLQLLDLYKNEDHSMPHEKNNAHARSKS